MASCVPVRRGLIRPAGTWRALARTAALLVILVGHACRAAQRELIDVSDYVNTEDIEPAGACTSGCVRTVVEAVARVKGEIECDLRVQNLLDHTKDDVRGGALNVVHSCSDSEGNLAYQGEGECLYSVCVSAQWENDEISYRVAVEHEVTFAAHSVRVQVYLNEYAEEVSVGGNSSTSSATSASDTSTPSGVYCSLGGGCTKASDCGASSTMVEVLAEDQVGDGWTGALPDRADTWAITQALSATDLFSPVAEGSLPDDHFSRKTSLCLADGLYSFSSSANAAWSDEGSWTVCEVEGGVGGSLEFEVAGLSCTVIDDSASGGPPNTDRETDAGDYCSLPEAQPCVGLDVGIVETSGPSVGMYYDEACLDGGGGVSGCGGGGVSTCRVCFVNRGLWEKDFPDERYPDWNDCPCCVASALGVTCQGGLVETTSSRSFFREAESFYLGGSTTMVALMGGLIGFCCFISCCCWRGIHKDKQKALTYKHSRSAIYEDYNDGETSPDISPPLRARQSSQPSTKLAYGKDSRLSPASEAGQLTYGKPKAKPKTKPPRPEKEPAPAAPVATVIPLESPVDDVPPRRSALPPVEPPGAMRLPGASRDCPPSDASWPSDPRVGVSVSGKKNPRWSGGRELRAYLRRTGYDKVEPDGNDVNKEEPAAGEPSQQRSPQRSGSFRAARAGSHRVLQAAKDASSKLSDRSSRKFDWVDESRVGDADGAQAHGIPASECGISMQDINESLGLSAGFAGDEPPGVPLGDLPVVPPPPPDVAPVPARITAVRTDKAKSRSRAKSRRGTDKPATRGRSSARADGNGDAERPRRPLSWGSRTSGRQRPIRVVPTDDPEEDDEFGKFDQSWTDRNWGGPSLEAPPPPMPANEAPAPRRRDDRGAAGRGASANERRAQKAAEEEEAAAAAAALEAEEVRRAEDQQRQQRQRRQRAQAAIHAASEAQRIAEEARREQMREREHELARERERQRQLEVDREHSRSAGGAAGDGTGGGRRRGRSVPNAREEAHEGGRAERERPVAGSTSVPVSKRDGGVGRSRSDSRERHRHRSGETRNNRARDRQRGGHGDAAEDPADRERDRASRSKSNPGGAGPTRETEAERRRRSSREDERRRDRSGHRSRSNGRNPATTAGAGAEHDKHGRHEDRHEQRKSAGRKELHRLVVEENQREKKNLESREKERERERERQETRGAPSGRRAGGGGSVERTGLPSASEAAAAAVASKRSSGTKFSNDPHAKQDRASRLRERQRRAPPGEQ